MEEDKDANTIKIYSKEELLIKLRTFTRKNFQKPKDGRYTVGLVGYPNVGKSSVINVVVGKKKVGVASQPGKTKHFQTLNVGKDLQLCDCPGLVFPSFANSKAEMTCCGVLPVDNIKDYQSPV